MAAPGDGYVSASEPDRGRGCSVHGHEKSDNRGQPSAADSGSAAGDDQLAVQFSALARTLEQQQDPHETLVEIVRAAVRLIPGCDGGVDQPRVGPGAGDLGGRIR